jgi:hypothetical protein
MQDREIPSEQWMPFINQFSRDHQGQTVTIEVLDPELGTHHLAENLPLMGLSFDVRGTRPASLEVSAGNLPDGLIRHVIDLPLAIRLASDTTEQDVSLRIQPAQGPSTLILLRGPVH